MRRSLVCISLGVAIGLLAFAFPGWAANIGRATYGIYSETYTGLQYDTLNPPESDGGFMAAYNATLSDDKTTFAEGVKSLKVVAPGVSGGVWVQFGYTNGANPQVPTNMSAYAGGKLRFSVRTSDNLQVKIEWKTASGTAGSAYRTMSELGVPLDGQWHSVSVPLTMFTGINLSAVTVVAGFWTPYVASPPATRTFWIDNVMWLKSTEGTVSATIRYITDDSPASEITWSNVTVGPTIWQKADQYIEVDLSYYHYPGWGIQMYTDNTAPDALPAYSLPTYTGAVYDPAGMVDELDTTQTLPMCWRMVDVTTTTLTIRETLDNHIYSQGLPGSYYCWFRMQDRQTPGFVDGNDSVTVWDNRGIHDSESTWASGITSNYIYIGANFSEAISTRNYRTNKLTLELFYE